MGSPVSNRSRFTVVAAAPAPDAAVQATGLQFPGPSAADAPVATPAVTAPLLLTAAEAAALCHASERTWRAWDAGGHIPEPVHVGRSVFWRPKELVAWVDAGCPDRHTWNVLRD